MLNKRVLILIFLVTFLTLLISCSPAPIPSNETPIIISTPVTTATVGLLYAYDVNATDPDGDTLIYSLDVKPSGMTINSATGLINWIPTAEGDYAVVVNVSDGDLDITQNFTIVVSKPTEPPNQSPIASFIATPTSGVAPLEAFFNASGSYDPDGNIISYEWDFKDGDTGSGEIVNHTFNSIGSYKVELTVTDDKGATDSTTKTITVTKPPNQPPIASFTANPNSGVVPLEIYFDASNSYDPDGNIVSYVWDFKDGNTGSGETINHTFTSAGSYNVDLTVMDNEGIIGLTTKTITVTESEPSGDVVITLDNWDQEYYEFFEEWSMVHAYYTIENNSSEAVYDYKIYFTVNCIDGNIYYDSWYENYTLTPGQSHSDYALIDTFGKQAYSVKINELAINVYH